MSAPRGVQRLQTVARDRYPVAVGLEQRISRCVGKRGLIAMGCLMGAVLTAIAAEMLLIGIERSIMQLPARKNIAPKSYPGGSFR